MTKVHNYNHIEDFHHISFTINFSVHNKLAIINLTQLGKLLSHSSILHEDLTWEVLVTTIWSYPKEHMIIWNGHLLELVLFERMGYK